MILDCPTCSAKFKVDAALLGETGRNVRCGNCGHGWHQTPPGPEPAEEGRPDRAAAAASEGDSRPARADTLDKLDEQRRRRRHKPAETTERTPFSRVLGWALLILFLAALVGGLVAAREKIVALAPGTAAYYERLGLQKRIGDGLDLRDVTSVRRSVDGESKLIVRGIVVNVSDRVLIVPRLRASLVDGGGAELANWTFVADSSELPPGGTTAFETTTSDPPARGNLSLVFVE